MTRFCVLFVLLGLISGIAIADPAIVINQGTGTCLQPGADADGNIIAGGQGFTTNKVENGNKVMMKCHSDNLVNLSGKAQNFSGFACYIISPSSGLWVTTYDSHANVSNNGGHDGSGNIGTLTCTFKER